jgi:hypothetical protein
MYVVRDMPTDCCISHMKYNFFYSIPRAYLLSVHVGLKRCEQLDMTSITSRLHAPSLCRSRNILLPPSSALHKKECTKRSRCKTDFQHIQRVWKRLKLITEYLHHFLQIIELILEFGILSHRMVVKYNRYVCPSIWAEAEEAVDNLTPPTNEVKRWHAVCTVLPMKRRTATQFALPPF